MKESPTISIIIPVCNSEKWIGRCIKSIFSQLTNDWELVIVNDGSVDDSESICKSMISGRPNCQLISVKRGGVSKARNVGIDNASGTYILFVDSDDFLSSNHLQNYIDAIPSDIIYQGYRLFDSETGITIEEKRKGPLSARDKEQTIEILRDLFEYENFFGPTWNKLFRRDIIERYHLRFNESINFREDEIFTFQYCAYIKTIKVLPTTTYNYRETPNSLMRRHIESEYLLKILNNSRESAMQLPLSENFRILIEEYYTDGIMFALSSFYYAQSTLGDRGKRYDFIHMAQERNMTYPTAKTKQAGLILKSAFIYDLFHVILYVCRKVKHFL